MGRKMYLTAIKYLAPVVLFSAYTFGAYSYGVKQEKTRWESKAYAAVVSAHEIAGKFTAGLLSDNKETEDDAQIQIDKLQNDLVVADSAANSLRDELDAYAKRAADSSRAAANCKATEAAAGVFADMYREADRLAGVYAKEAGKRRIAGMACEKYATDLRNRIKALP